MLLQLLRLYVKINYVDFEFPSLVGGWLLTMERNLRAKQICWKENGTIFLLLTTLPRVDKWKPWTRSFSESSSRTVNESQRFWHEMLPNALWAYRTNARMSTGVTPYSLVYGAEAVLPLETEIPSYWLSIAADLSPSSSQYAEATVIWIRSFGWTSVACFTAFGHL